jgi:anti-sigma factor RsiW
MECKKAKGIILSDYADGLLRGHALEELEAHLRSCPQCRSFASDIVSAGKLFRSHGRETAPAVVWERIRAEIVSAMGKPGVLGAALDRVRQGLSGLKPSVAAVTAAALLVFLVVAARVMHERSDYLSAIAAEGIVPTEYLYGANGSEYDMGTSVEEFLL